MTVHAMPENFPVRRDSIEELVGHRDRALQLVEAGLRTLAEAEATSQRAAPGLASYCTGFLSALEFRGIYWEERQDEAISDLLARARKAIDRSAWKSLQQISGLRNIMDAQAHEQFDEQMDKDVPVFTVNNVIATFAGLAAKAPEIFERGVVNVFESLNTKHYKTNSAFRIGAKIIMTSALNQAQYGSGWNYYGRGQKTVGDMDRIFHVLDGKKPPEAGNAADAIGYAHARKEKTCQTDYFYCRMFRGNGNLHIRFRRPDLVDKVNGILASHYGEALPDDRKQARR